MKYDEETKLRAVEMYRANPDMLVPDIAIAVGVSRRTVQKWAREAGVEGRSPKTVTLFTEETKSKAVAMYLDGHVMWRIEGRTGMGEASIRNAVRKAGHQLRPSGVRGSKQ